MDIQPIPMRIPALDTPAISPKTETPATTGADTSGAAGGGFGQALSNAISGLNESQNAADDASVRMAAGEPIDLHEVMLARETASLDFQLAVQVRNKLVEAYQDVMRMQI
jgi:flagellar hook-basal body complex protein FliE